MKRMVLVVLFCVLCATAIYSQSVPRGRGGVDPGLTGAPPIFNNSNPWDLMRVPVTVPALSRAPQPHPDDFVSVSQLHIPSKAIKEFARSQQAIKSGDLHGSTAHLQKALRIYPDFIEAHNALGLRFLELGQYQAALAEHEAALAVDPHVPQSHRDRAFALLILNRSKDAEAEAREAIDLDPQALVPRYILARALIGQGLVTPETVAMLQQSEKVIPNASLVLAQIYFTRGQTDQVIAALHQYLKAPTDADNQHKAECWATQLSGQLAPAGCPFNETRPSFH